MTLGEGAISALGPSSRDLSNSAGFSWELNVTFCSVRLTMFACVYVSLQGQVLLPPYHPPPTVIFLGKRAGRWRGTVPGSHSWGVAEPGLESSFLASYPVPSASGSVGSVFRLTEWQGVLKHTV